ncbi:hypothetical protein GUITHDRAFT_57261, partial [Guillardia theta CCMP2712]
ERKASDLIYDVFPEHIAHALRDGKKVEPEKKEMVSIYFSDIVGFTDICSKIDVEKVSDMLDRLYTALDRIAGELDIFKIETIGDAYMCVTNLVEEQEDHAARLAFFAMKAVQVAAETMVDEEQKELGCVKLRIGINSGPVVANVIGTSRPKYTLFGDTVNIASRMESNSLPQKILCSEEQKQSFEQRVCVLERGIIRVKGKGPMETYWI